MQKQNLVHSDTRMLLRPECCLSNDLHRHPSQQSVDVDCSGSVAPGRSIDALQQPASCKQARVQGHGTSESVPAQ
jgi:hypothetical protein